MSNYCPHCGQSMKKEAAPKKKAAPRKTAPKKAGINWPGLLWLIAWRLEAGVNRPAAVGLWLVVFDKLSAISGMGDSPRKGSAVLRLLCRYTE